MFPLLIGIKRNKHILSHLQTLTDDAIKTSLSIMSVLYTQYFYYLGVQSYFKNHAAPFDSKTFNLKVIIPFF